MSPLELSVHDNLLLSYTVSAERREITLHTAFHEVEPPEYTDVVFSGLEAYHFEGDNFGTIIFDVSETDALELYEEERARFEAGVPYAWPAWNASAEAARAYIAGNGLRAFVLSSSFGMTGWVLAREVRRVRAGVEGNTAPV